MNTDNQQTPQNLNDMFKLPGVISWLLNQSPSIVILVVVVSWQTKHNAILEGKIDQCNRDRIGMYESQMSVMIQALNQNKMAMENNSKALENNSLMIQNLGRRKN